MKISHIPDKEFKVIFKKLSEVKRTVFEQRDGKYKYQTEITELKNIITKLENPIKGSNSRLYGGAKESVNLKARQWNASNQRSKKKRE